MITALEAQNAARRYVQALEIDSGCELALLEKSTMEHPCGWMFFYQSRAFVESGDPAQALAGNAPLIVGRNDGEVVVAGTAESPQYYLAAYQAKLQLGGA